MMRLLATLICCLVGFGVSLGFLLFSGQIPQSYVDRAIDHLPAELVSWNGAGFGEASGSVSEVNWPPRVGETYPDLTLTDQYGEKVRLRDFAGKVILIELAAVPCHGCQAFAGGNEHGGFAGFTAQPGLESIHQYATTYGNVDLGKDPDVVFVQLLLYGKKMRTPTAEEVGGWASHFHMNESPNRSGRPNQFVLRGTPELLTGNVHDRIPGFQLIGRDFVLRSESSGAHPETDLYQQLLPELGRLSRDGRGSGHGSRVE